MRDFDAKSLNGCLYCNWGTLTGAPPTSEEKKAIVEVFVELHSYAKEAGVRLGIEPVNRYETPLPILKDQKEPHIQGGGG